MVDDTMKHLKLSGHDIVLRKKTALDIETITEVAIAAFRDHPFGNQTEHFIVNALRRADALAVSISATG